MQASVTSRQFLLVTKLGFRNAPACLNNPAQQSGGFLQLPVGSPSGRRTLAGTARSTRSVW